MKLLIISSNVTWRNFHDSIRRYNILSGFIEAIGYDVFVLLLLLFVLLQLLCHSLTETPPQWDFLLSMART
jgi:hypothetical protein